jgi:signal transduction histidine kinase
MSESPPERSGDGSQRLHHCIRDLAALHALPSMCIGRSFEEAFDIVLDALPTALDCELVYLLVPGTPSNERAAVGRNAATSEQLTAMRAALSEGVSTTDALVVPGVGPVYCMEAELPLGRQRGRLVGGRREPLDPETDRVLVRSAANLVGTTLETAVVLEGARRKDEFLAMLGHELRNPLAPIMTAVELLSRHPEVAREREVIGRNTEHLVRLVDDLLDISRVTCGYVELKDELVTLAAIVERAVEIATPIINRNRHTLTLGDPGRLVLRGDLVRLAQVFGNLLVNAAKFTPAGGHIGLRIEPAGDRVRVRVEDNGRGIERQHLAQIFEPFVQVDPPTDALRGGLGLGLAIVSNLVARHNGTISAESEGKGKGAVFTVSLPTVASIAPIAPMPRQVATVSRGGLRVLVVDDNVDLAELLAEALGRAGFETEVAFDAHAALERWRTFSPHAAVLDVGLPTLDGYELARAVRAEHGLTPTLIAATGYGQPRDRLAAHDAGFDLHLVEAGQREPARDRARRTSRPSELKRRRAQAACTSPEHLTLPIAGHTP